MTRREMRECMFCLLFQNEFYPAGEFEEQRDIYLEEKKLSDADETEIRHKLEQLILHLPEIDGKIIGDVQRLETGSDCQGRAGDSEARRV